MKNRFTRIFLLQILIIPFIGFSQTDYEFWFAAPAITQAFVPPSQLLYINLNQPIRLYFTTFNGPATVTVSIPANSDFIPIVTVVNNATAGMVNLTNFINDVETKPPDLILNNGLHITSDKPITAYYEVESPYNAEIWPLFGRNALGYEFIVPSQHHYSNYPYSSPPARNTFDVVATEDSTTVTIVPKVALVDHFPSDTFAIMMNKGQTYSGSAISGDSTAHLAGTFVFSDKPVAVTMCDDVILYPNATSNSVDVAGAQLIPRNLCGKDYISVHDENWYTPRSRFYVYAFEDSTQLIYNDSISLITKWINRGDSAEFWFHFLSGGWGSVPHIQSSKPVMVYHFAAPNFMYPDGSAPQPSSAILPPIPCGGSKSVTYTRTPPMGMWGEFDLDFVTKKVYKGGYKFTPPIIGWDTNVYMTVPGTNGQYVAQGAVWGAFPIGTTLKISNSKGRFLFYSETSCAATDTASFSKLGYFSDFSTLNLGPDRKICPGDSTLLDAGFERDTYLWNTGDTTRIIWAKSAGTYWVHTTEEGNCSLSDTILISYFFYTPVNLGPDRIICNGDSILLNAGPGRAWYQWNNGATTQEIWAKTSGYYWVTVPDIHCTVSDTMYLATSPVPSVTNNPLLKSICSGESTNILLTSNVPGTTFNWTASLTSGNITGYSADSGLIVNQVLINSLSTPGIVTYHITPKVGSCIGTTVDFPVTVNAGDSVKVSISASANNICEGTPVTFTAIPTNGGTNPSYQWKVNGIDNGPNNPVFTYSPNNGDVVTCVLTSSNTVCISNNPATSNQLNMVILSNTVVAVTIAASQNPQCAGLPVTFTATPVNGGSSPAYQWKVNGLNVGPDSPNYTYNPLNGDVVTCVLNSSEICTINNPATSNQVIMVIMDILDVSVTISPSANPFCEGSSVTYTATPTNGGTLPNYQWKVNGINAGLNSPTYTYNPSNGDIVTCLLNSSEMCTTNNPATSNQVIMVINSNLPVGVSIAPSANPFCPGNSVTFTATPVNGGTNPTYQWKVNGINTGSNSPTFLYNPASGDLVSCIMTSNLSCVTGNPATSNTIVMSGTLAPIVTFTLCNDSITTTNAKPFKLKGGIPLGGSYSGPGVNSLTGIFTPSIAGTGTKTLTYTYTNAALCSSSANHQFVIRNPSFVICGTDLTDIRDNKTYPTVQIGSQCWFAEDLNYGNEIPSTQNQRDNCIPEKYRVSSIQHPASLYQWDELMQYDESVSNQGMCPPAWHVPTENDWNTLFAEWTNNAFAAWPLLSTGFSGFNAFLSGTIHMNKTTDWPGFATFFWSSTSHGTEKAWSHGMNSIDPSVSGYPSLRTNAFSVRCVHD